MTDPIKDPPDTDTKQTPEQIQKQKEFVENVITQIKEYRENPSLGIDPETFMAFIGTDKTKRVWKLNPQGHTKTNRDKIKKANLELIELITNTKTSIQQIKNIDKIDELTNTILTLGLDSSFDYNKSAEDELVGPAQLRFLAQEIGHFLVVLGGKAGYKHSKMLQLMEQFSP